MSSNSPPADDNILNFKWGYAIATEQVMTLRASDLENLITILLLSQTATFQISESLSKLQALDYQGSKESNIRALETNKRALDLAKQLRSRFMDAVSLPAKEDTVDE